MVPLHATLAQQMLDFHGWHFWTQMIYFIQKSSLSSWRLPAEAEQIVRSCLAGLSLTQEFSYRPIASAKLLLQKTLFSQKKQLSRHQVGLSIGRHLGGSVGLIPYFNDTKILNS